LSLKEAAAPRTVDIGPAAKSLIGKVDTDSVKRDFFRPALDRDARERFRDKLRLLDLGLENRLSDRIGLLTRQADAAGRSRPGLTRPDRFSTKRGAPHAALSSSRRRPGPCARGCPAAASCPILYIHTV